MGKVFMVLGGIWLGAGLLSLGLYITVALKLGFVWQWSPLFNLCIAGIPIGATLLFFGIKCNRRLV
jgi:hypothetical protein